MEIDIKLCKQTIEWKSVDGLRRQGYELCNKPAKYKVTYISPSNNKEKIEYLCKRHFGQMKRWTDQVYTKTGFDTNFRYEEL